MPPQTRTAYARVLAQPRAATTFLFSLVGRSAYALVYLPLLYAAHVLTGSLAAAGLAVALYGAAVACFAPLKAILIDRAGARTVLLALSLASGALLAAIALLTTAASPSSVLHDAGDLGWAAYNALLLCACVLVGAASPPLGPTMRVAWARLLPQKDLQAGLSLDAVVEELLYLAGPAVAGLLLVWLTPGQALLMPAALLALGGSTFALTPALREKQTRSGPAPSNTSRDAPSVKPRHDLRGKNSRLITNPRFAALLVPPLAAGAILGLVSVLVPALEGEIGGTGLVGLALGLFAAASAAGGLIYGQLRLKRTTKRVLFAAAGLLVAATAAMAVPLGLGAHAAWLFVALMVAGLFFSPVMIGAYLVAPQAAGEAQQNAATTWVNTAHNLGSAVVTAGAAWLIQAWGPAPAVLLITGALVLGLAATAAGIRSGSARTAPTPV